LIIEVITGAVGAIIASYLWESQLRDRISISRITSSQDPNIEGFLELYSSLFDDDGTNYSLEEWLELFGDNPKFPDKKHVKTENIILVAKFKKEIVGFVTCHFYFEKKKAIISYLGINEKLEARQSATRKILRKLKAVLTKNKYVCEYLFFDLQGIDPTLTQEEKTKRKAKSRLFKQKAKSFSLCAYILQFDYKCPKVSISDGAREYPFILMCIPVKGQLPRQIPKITIMEFLSFIYNDCYGDLYHIDDPRFKTHHDYLSELIYYYDNTLPDYISVE
jgi:hypothetical protein